MIVITDIRRTMVARESQTRLFNLNVADVTAERFRRCSFQQHFAEKTSDVLVLKMVT